ncbi:hypothetical protein ATCC90586_002427 [Pythium insidiosum]|nr:hypothetical protein ATCC90586_002427 [Pythium insidiosum]
MEIEIGTRVSIGASGKTGVVRYVGEVDDLAGEWVGIELDKPEGKHSGDLNGKVYFTSEIEQLKASLALASSSQRPSQIPASAAELSEENMKLRAAIKALHDRNADEKNELNKKLRQLQRECAELVNLQEEVEQLARLEEQLTREREQFNAALDESHKDKIALDNLNRELRKQLKRSSDMEASMQSGSSRTKSALSQGDAEAFRKAFVVKEEGLSAAMAHAIEQGEIAFGWQPPEMERPPVLVGRVTLRPFGTTARPPNHDDDDDDAMVDVEPTPPPPVPLLLNPLQVQQLSRALVC